MSEINEDVVNHPKHYQLGGMECIDVLQMVLSEEEFRGFCKGNLIKYVWRASQKNGEEDLQKAKWYYDKLYDNPAIDDLW